MALPLNALAGAVPQQQPAMAALAAPEGAGDEDAIKQAFSRLNEIIGGMQGVDVNQIFSPYLKRAEEAPVAEAPGRFEAFVRGMSPQGSQGVMQQLGQKREDEKSRFEKLMEAERDILGMKLQQEMEKGKASQALKTLEQQKLLEHKLELSSKERAKTQADEQDRIKRQRDLEDYEKKQKILFGEKKGLEETKKGHARELIEHRARQVAQTMGFDERMTLKLIDLVSAPLLIQMRSAFDPMMGTATEEDPAVQQQMIAAMQAKIMEAAQQLQANMPSKEGAAPSKQPSALPKGVQEDPNDPIQAAYLRRKRGQKK